MFARGDMAAPCDPKVFQEISDIMKSHSTQLVLGYTKIHVAKKPSAHTTHERCKQSCYVYT